MAASPIKIDTATAKRLIFESQGLSKGYAVSPDKTGTAQVIEQLGYVQIDTIAVIERAHHHTLWSRQPDYRPDMLDALQARDRRVFEAWTHAASYVPMHSYRYHLPQMRAFATHARNRAWLKQNQQVVSEVLERIKQEGPLGSANFTTSGKRGPWWDWKPAKQALEMLVSMGELMVTARRNFQRIYDLTERVLPADIDATEPDPIELGRFIVKSILRAQGVASVSEMRWRLCSRREIENAVSDMSSAGEIVPVEIDEIPDELYYTLADSAAKLETQPLSTPEVHILSPFDNVVIDRRRLARFFHYDYKIECYTPATQRKYGYFCLPILWGENFVGRLDAKADRKARTFIIRALILEPDFQADEDFLSDFATKLWIFASFNGCDDVTIIATTPESLRTLLTATLKRCA